MNFIHSIVLPGRTINTVISQSGKQLIPPEDWSFLPAGDAAITRKVKSKGETWIVQVRKGRRLISQGLWANKTHIMEAQKEVEAKRATPEYAKRKAYDSKRREDKQNEYVAEFFNQVINFLKFHPQYKQQAQLLAKQITSHATPIGSGTVARTKQIPLNKRAEAATIAWMRHQTTAYDSMNIERIKGRRREIRRQLAEKSVQILQVYRQGHDIPSNCPLNKTLS